MNNEPDRKHEGMYLLSFEYLIIIINLFPCRLSKGLAATIEERQLLGIHGLLPARYVLQLVKGI